jgi:hypothetical protein
MASPEKIIAAEEEITRFIPQRPPMVMIGKLILAVDKTTTTSLLIRDDNIFCECGFLREPGLIENMAQTAAAGNSFRGGNGQSEPLTGYIGGIRNLRIFGFPPVGCEITTTVTVEHEVFDATVVTGKVFLEGKLMAECELKIFLIRK